MKVTDLMDERMDFWKSTQGALSKLEENYHFFGDWPLALAAYNAGLGGVNRIVKRTNIRNYWTLGVKKELKTETVHYVPKLLAVSWILSNPRQYGIESWPEAPQWVRINTKQSVDLELLAEEAGVDPAPLIAGNQELIYRVTPEDPAYRLKAPAEYAAAINEVLARQDKKLIKYYRYSIKSGDTLSALARHYQVSVNLIENANPGIRARFLKIGEIIRIPAFKEVGPYTRQVPAADTALSFGGTHLVKQGETLWSIALSYHVDPEVLAEANGMKLSDILSIGKSLKTPRNN
jgi:membrane-bound lytic murein transglycosylase D